MTYIVECIVVMGVSGSGKTTVGRVLAQELGWSFVEGDDFHSAENVAKMRDGVPLTDEDRLPWLRDLHAWLMGKHADGTEVVASCSALRRSYRTVLAQDAPWMRFCHLDLAEEVLAARLSGRRDHFMSASLLRSQLETLEPLGPDEPGVVVDGDGPTDQVVGRARAALSL